MSATTKDHAPYRADQVGSLLRPAELKAAREKAAKGEITKAEAKLGWTPTVGFEQLVQMMVDADLELATREAGAA